MYACQAPKFCSVFASGVPSSQYSFSLMRKTVLSRCYHSELGAQMYVCQASKFSKQKHSKREFEIATSLRSSQQASTRRHRVAALRASPRFRAAGYRA
jgi:hypothetical protein